MTYNITVIWRDSATKYTQCVSMNLDAETAGAELAETLDVILEDGKPVKPSLKLLKKTLGPYADDEYIRQEFERMTKAWKLYRKFESFVESGECGSFCGSVGDNDTVIMEALKR